jgi:tetratricopeptide (TPR) repeat protein
MEVTMKRFSLALALSAALAGPAAAQQAKPGAPAASPAESYAARRPAAMKDVGSRLEGPGDFAWSNELKQTALEVYKEILQFDPENKKANDRLGLELKDGTWVANEAKQKKIAELEDLSKGEKKRGEFDKKLKDAHKSAAKVLSDLGLLALSAGDEDAAKTHFKAALEFDDQNAAANEKCGNKLVDGKWYTHRALAHRDWVKLYKTSLAKAQALAVQPVNCDESTGICEAAGIPAKRYKTKNFRIEGNMTDGEIKDTLVWLERARQLYMDLYDVPERFLDYSADPDVFVLVGTKELHERLIDACGLIPKERKSFAKKFTSNAITNKLTLSLAQNGESAQRHCIHTATHSFVADSFGQHSPWLKEALANSVSAAIKGADLTVCFGGEGTTGGIHLENISLEQAPPLLRDLIKAGKDTPIGNFVKLPSDAMTAQMIAKSWSIVMFLMEMDRGQAREYLASSGQGGDGEKSRDDKVLKQFFQDYENWAALDTAWREWALDVYKP